MFYGYLQIPLNILTWNSSPVCVFSQIFIKYCLWKMNENLWAHSKITEESVLVDLLEQIKPNMLLVGLEVEDATRVT